MASQPKEIKSQRSRTLDLPPSCLEFSPTSPSHFLVGTYDLQREEGEDTADLPGGAQRRNGSIVVFQLVNKDIIHVQTEARPSAILDLHFQRVLGKDDVLGVVSSTGTFEIFKFSASSRSNILTLISIKRIPGVEGDVLFLSFTWHPTMADVVAISTSQGSIYLLRLSPDYMTFQWTTSPAIRHGLEAWCVAIVPAMSSAQEGDEMARTDSSFFTLCSGGDDSILQYLSCNVESDTPLYLESLDLGMPFTAKRVQGHGAGVTAILPLPCWKNLVVTGSYDDHIRVYSITPLHESYGVPNVKLLTEANLGGGVWRLRLVRSEDGGPGMEWRATILVSCMHAGSRLIELRGTEGGKCEVFVLGRFEEHTSMNYASDFQPGGPEKELVCVSSSFYDRLLCLWSIELY